MERRSSQNCGSDTPGIVLGVGLRGKSVQEQPQHLLPFIVSSLSGNLISPSLQEVFKGQAFAVCGRQEIRQSRCLKGSFIPGCPVEWGLLECWAVSVCFSPGCFPSSASLLLELLRTGEIMNELVWSWAAQASSCLSFLRCCSLCWHKDLQSI